MREARGSSLRRVARLFRGRDDGSLQNASLETRVTHRKLKACTTLLLAIPLLTFGQEIDPKAAWAREYNNDDRWSETNVGPFLSSVLRTPGGVIAKGLTVRVNENLHAAYDLKTATLRAAWTGDSLEFNGYKFGMVRAPKIAGDVFLVCSQPGWSSAKEVRYRGFYQHGEQIVVEYLVDGIRLRETLGASAESGVLIRTLQIAPHDSRLRLLLSDQPIYDGATRPKITLTPTEFALLSSSSDAVNLEIPPCESEVTIQVSYGEIENAKPEPIEKIQQLLEPGESLWTEKIKTSGELGSPCGAYAVDTINVPFENPWRALMFFSGLDFFSIGDALACTVHGDVWLVSGIDEKLEKLTWKRYATGLHQPMGLRIVDDKAYVLGRGQITRLHDRNGDGEADFYENFNNDGETSTSGHDYASCLETDSEGNFYYIRAHEGVVRVSADGRRHTAIATGFRNPIGLGVGRNGVITAAPQEGNWTPASFIAEVQEGGYYGYPGPRVSADRPLGYDLPLCWLPRVQDSSSGGQLWVESGGRWGPLEGQLLHLGYGQCQLMLVLRDRVNGVAQGGTVRFPFQFQSGVMRGRFNPRDGQLYVCGMRGWQTSGIKDGCLQRVRYTGGELHMPVSLKVLADGVEIGFSQPLDEKLATDPARYAVSQWNYRYTGDYGSLEYRVSDPEHPGHDRVDVLAAELKDDGKTVSLKLAEVRPVMQMKVDFDLEPSDTAPAPPAFDHVAAIKNLGPKDVEAGRQLYAQYCASCHGQDGALALNPLARRFASDELKFGADPYSLWKTTSYGNGLMFRWDSVLSVKQRYQMVHFIREEIIKKSNPEQYFQVNDAYFEKLPETAAADAKREADKVRKTASGDKMIGTIYHTINIVPEN